VYAAPTWEATLAMRKLWRGEAHPLANDHHFFVEKCRFEFDRPVPFEVGGDLGGERTTLEFSRHPTPIPLVDFRKLGRG
jgi:diacylglycerol kinase family enzyme